MLLSSFEAITGMPEVFGYIFIFVLGSLIGSFLNVVIHRVPREESIVFPNSGCPKCGQAIKPYDNIPVLSWVILGGKCRSCKVPISPRYPAVELLTAILYVLTYWRLGFTPLLPVGLIFVAAIISLMFIDAEHMILPNVITYPMFVLAVVVRIALPIVTGNDVFGDSAVWPTSNMSDYPLWLVSLAGALLGALAGGGFLWAVGEIWKRLRGVEAMGLGDVKMMLGVGALLGWHLTLLTIFFGAFGGALIGSVLITLRKDKDLQSHIPFGIFLGFGAIASMLFGSQLISWYFEKFIR
jgi:leader peptidase (prepilin peptidase)/N-methyltransferase